MHIARVYVSGYKNVNATLGWSQAVVLFGRNDAGKSNLLEAIVWASGGDAARHDPLTTPGAEPSVSFLVELDQLDEESSLDADLLARLLQARHVPPLFPYAYPDEPPPDPELEQELWGGEMVLSQFPAASLEWDLGKSDEDLRPRQFKLGTVGSMYSPSDPVNTVGSIAKVREELRIRALDYAADALLQAREHDPNAEETFVTLLDQCLRSRWLLCDAEAGIAWLAPAPNECDAAAFEAAERLVSSLREKRIPILDEFARQLVARSADSTAFLAIPNTHSFRPWQVVWVSGSPERLEELARNVGEFVRSRLERVLRRSGHAADPWLDQDESGATVISGAVRDLCSSLSERATSIAPPFVTRDYEIRVEPLSPVHWHRYGERRVRLAVALREDEESFDLSVAGSGLAVWAGFAIEEAMREVDLDLDAELQRIIRDTPSKSATTDRAPRQEPSIGSQTRLYILDEPERHLHPQAQEQAARWLARRIDGRTSLLLATHALPFLSLPTNDVEYSLVSRMSGRVTRTDSITDDVWGALDARTSEAGLGNRAQLIQIARAFLVVEGAHDEAVIRHFYRQELERHRIVVLPSRGARKVRSLIEAELLALVDVPLIILFDDIRAAAVVGEARPSRKDVAAYALWEMLQHWPPERRRPHVVDFPLPDIYCALPNQCVRQTVKARGGSFPGWDPIIEAFVADGDGVGFKEFFVKRVGLPQDTDTSALLEEILEQCRLEPKEQLQTAMAEVLDRALAGQA